MSVMDEVRNLILSDSRTIYQISKESKVAQSVLGRFAGGKDAGLDTLEKIAKHYGYRIELVRKAK